MGNIRKVRMFPLDFEEFLYANGMNEVTIGTLRSKFQNQCRYYFECPGNFLLEIPFWRVRGQKSVKIVS